MQDQAGDESMYRRALRDLHSADLYPPVSQGIIVNKLVMWGEPTVPHVIHVLRLGSNGARQLAAKILARIGEPAMEGLAVALESKDPTIRQTSVEALCELKTERAIELLRQLVLSSVKDLKAKRRQVRIRKVVIVAAMSILIGLVLYFHSFKSLGSSQFLLQMIIQICLAGGYVDATLASRKTAAEALANVDDVRMIDALAVCLDISDPETKKIVRSALVRLLPRVKTSDDLKLTNESYEQLLSELKTGERSLKLAILKALEQIGDEKAVPVVEYLTANAWDAEIVTAAKECLPALRHRAEQCRLASTLLRPADAQQTDAEILLRPAKGMAVEHEHLLRTIE